MGTNGFSPFGPLQFEVVVYLRGGRKSRQALLVKPTWTDCRPQHAPQRLRLSHCPRIRSGFEQLPRNGGPPNNRSGGWPRLRSAPRDCTYTIYERFQAVKRFVKTCCRVAILVLCPQCRNDSRRLFDAAGGVRIKPEHHMVDSQSRVSGEPIRSCIDRQGRRN